MKQIIIFLLVIILLIIGYSQYKQYKRFTLENYEYQVNDSIDLDYHDKSFLLDYYEAVEELNGYVITQWSANEIDVRTPEEDDEEHQFALKEYAKSLAKVKFYEDQLLKSVELKSKGMSNEDIKLYEEEGVTMKEKQRIEHKIKLHKMFDDASKSLRIGDQSAFIYEIQKLLKNKGHDIPLDGVLRNITTEALMAFETKHGLYADGRLDVFTLEKLVE
jgi:hypothetical protein